MLSANTWPQTPSSTIPRIETDWMKKYQEAIIVCDQQNQECHKSLSKMDAATVQDNWTVIITAALVGVLAGTVAEYQMVKH